MRYKPNHPLADKDGWVELNDDYWNYLPDNSNNSGVQIISDGMEPTRHMADGNYYTSKSEFRKATKRAGCIEVGNDPSVMPKPREYRMPSKQERIEHIKHAIHTLKQKG